MVSASKPADATTSAEAPATTTRPVARLNARISAYLADSLILVAFVLVFFVAGGSILLLSSDMGSGEPPDWAYYACVMVFLGGTVISWTLFNLALMRVRGQTAGMYVIGIRAVREDGTPITTRATLLRWFGLHPLLFHPFLLPIWGVLSLLVVSLTLSQVALIVTVALLFLCVVSPLASLVTLVANPERRAPHDRLARTLVVHLDQP